MWYNPYKGDMRIKLKITAIAAGIIAGVGLAAAIPLLVFFARSPVLVVSDHSSILLYGASRIRQETQRSSLALFRPVKSVVVADDVGDDIIQFAIVEISARPFCVLFPLRFAQAARLYREQNPAVPVILLEGRYAEDANPAAAVIGSGTGDYFLYKTDVAADFYLAGLAAAVLDGEKNGQIAVFLEAHIQTQAGEAFLRGLDYMEKPLQTTFFTSFSQFSGISDLSCVVLAGVGVDYLDKYAGVPVIFFTWAEPSIIPFDVVVVFNDSPWIQAARAAGMAAARIADGQIQSERIILSGRDIDKVTLQKLRKLGQK